MSGKHKDDNQRAPYLVLHMAILRTTRLISCRFWRLPSCCRVWSMRATAYLAVIRGRVCLRQLAFLNAENGAGFMRIVRLSSRSLSTRRAAHAGLQTRLATGGSSAYDLDRDIGIRQSPRGFS